MHNSLHLQLLVEAVLSLKVMIAGSACVVHFCRILKASIATAESLWRSSLMSSILRRGEAR
eukprot:236783-Amphidinium_carterae.1